MVNSPSRLNSRPADPPSLGGPVRHSIALPLPGPRLPCGVGTARPHGRCCRPDARPQSNQIKPPRPPFASFAGTPTRSPKPENHARFRLNQGKNPFKNVKIKVNPELTNDWQITSSGARPSPGAATTEPAGRSAPFAARAMPPLSGSSAVNLPFRVFGVFRGYPPIVSIDGFQFEFWPADLKISP